MTLEFVYWRDGEFWLGYLKDYPDYMTQAHSLEELEENLRELYRDMTSGKIHELRGDQHPGRRGRRPAGASRGLTPRRSPR